MASMAVSPEATSGAGTLFEYRVAALALSRLLRGGHVPVGVDLPVVSVALQQRVAGSDFDDIVMRASSPHHATTIEFQVKKKLGVTGSSQALISVLGQATASWRKREHSLRSGRLLLGVAAGGPEDELRELASLAGKAHEGSTLDSFRLLLAEGVTDRRLRTRYDHIVTALTTATGVTDRSEAENLAHRVLSRLHVWQVDASEDGRDWRRELDDLQPFAQRSGQTAGVLLERLKGLAEAVGPHAGELDADSVRAWFRRKYAVDLTMLESAVAPSMGGIRAEVHGPAFFGHSQVFNGVTFNVNVPPAAVGEAT